MKTKSKRIDYYPIGIIVIILVVLSGFILYFKAKDKTEINEVNFDTINYLFRNNNYRIPKQYTLSITQSASQPAKKHITTGNLYTDSNMKFALHYPPAWQIQTLKLKKGEEYKIKRRVFTVLSDDTGEKIETEFYQINILAEKADTDLIILSKNLDWQITIQAQKDFIAGNCGYESWTPDAFDHDFYKKMYLGNKLVIRPNFENGKIRLVDGPVGSEKIPFPQMLTAYEEKNLPPKVINSVPCIDVKNIPIRFIINYHSPFLNADNFNNKNYTKYIDSQMLKESDDIIQSIYYLNQ